ncbi:MULTISPECIES: phosphoglycerate kinase [Ahrensia]|uniref:phosphoglycerate kinase n=1 Tax=Ahrensia TaxID=152180 RepID=UPI0003A0E308|nr:MULTISPECIES: phosphoglycerate kinase [Ahrensia]
MTFKTLDDLPNDIAGKRALVRVDLNVPIVDGAVSDRTRLQRIAPTIEELSRKGVKVVLLAHFGRPKGKVVEEMSLRPIAQALEEVLDHRVDFAHNCIGAEAAKEVGEMTGGDIVLLENTRFHDGEEKNDAAFAKALAENGDIYINDAFSAAHRAHASTEGLAHLLPAFAGRTMEAELNALNKALGDPKRPLGAVVGGAKVSTKIDLLENLVGKLDVLIIGGGMANTFIAANGAEMGASLQEADMHDKAKAIMAAAEKSGCRIVLPVDGRVTTEFAPNAPTESITFDSETKLRDDQMSLDAGDEAVKNVIAEFDKLNTLIWNGPFGVFEMPPFDTATMATAKAAAALTKSGRLISVAGGGDTVSALNQAGVAGDFTYISTAGGAFLEWMEGKELPGVKALG